MTANGPRAVATSRIDPADAGCGFRSGVHALDDFFARHALANDRAGIGATYVMRRETQQDPTLPSVLGFYTLSMALLESTLAAEVIGVRLPGYPMPAALLGRLAIDQRAQGRGLGEALLLDALDRVAAVAENIGCVGVLVDAKDESVERFYARYDFVTVDDTAWPRRMFVAIGTVRAALAR